MKKYNKNFLFLSHFFFILSFLIAGNVPFALAGEEEAREAGETLSIQKKVDIREYALPTENSVPYGIGIDSKGRVWYTAQLANQIGFLDPDTGEIREYKIPSAAALPKSDWKYDPVKKEAPKPEDTYNIFSVGSPGELLVDSRDRIWFVQNLGNRVTMFDPETEKFIEYEVPTPGSQPYSLAVDGDQNIWFIERNANKIGKLDIKAGKIFEYPLKGERHRLSSIAVDNEQNIWVTDIADNSVARFIPSKGTLKRYPVYERVSQPQGGVIGGDGNLWFILAKARKIAMLETRTGKISYSLLPSYNSVAQDIALDASGKVWYVDSFRNKAGFFNPQGPQLREWDIPTFNSQPMQIAIDRAGDVWFTESDRNANKIGRLLVASLPEEKELALPALADAPDQAEKVKERVPVWVYAVLLIVVLLIVLRIIKK